MANRPSWTNIPQTNFAGPLAAFNSAADRMGRGIGGIGDVAEGYVERKKTENTDKAVQALMGAAPGERAELIKGFASSGVNLDGKQIMEAGFKLEQGDLAQEGMGLRRDAGQRAEAAVEYKAGRDAIADAANASAASRADLGNNIAIHKLNQGAAEYNSENKVLIDAGLAKAKPMFPGGQIASRQEASVPVGQANLVAAANQGADTPAQDQVQGAIQNQEQPVVQNQTPGVIGVEAARNIAIDRMKTPEYAQTLATYGGDTKKALAGMTTDAMVESAGEMFTPLITDLSDRIQVAKDNFFTDDGKLVLDATDKDGKMSGELTKLRDSMDSDLGTMKEQLNLSLKNVPAGTSRKDYEARLRNELGITELEKAKTSFDDDITRNLRSEKAMRKTDRKTGKDLNQDYKTKGSPSSTFKKYFGETDFKLNDLNSNIKDARGLAHNAYSNVPDGVWAEAANNVAEPKNNLIGGGGHLELRDGGSDDKGMIAQAIYDEVRQIVADQNEYSGGTFSTAVFGLDPMEKQALESKAQANTREKTGKPLSKLLGAAQKVYGFTPMGISKKAAEAGVGFTNSIYNELTDPSSRQGLVDQLRGSK